MQKHLRMCFYLVWHSLIPLSFLHFLLAGNLSAQSRFYLCSDVSSLPAVCVCVWLQVQQCWRCSTLCSNTWGWAWTSSWARAPGETPAPAFHPAAAAKRAKRESSRTPSSKPSVWFLFAPSVFWTGTRRPTSTLRATARCKENQTSVFWAEMLLGWSSSCLCDSEDEIRINGGENVLLTSYKDPSLCVWALTHGLTCPPARLFRRKSARLPASRSHDVHHGQSARVRDPLPHLGHREDRVSHTFIIRVPRRSHMLLLQPISSQLPEAHLDECRDGLALNMLAPLSLFFHSEHNRKLNRSSFVMNNSFCFNWNWSQSSHICCWSHSSWEKYQHLKGKNIFSTQLSEYLLAIRVSAAHGYVET